MKKRILTLLLTVAAPFVYAGEPNPEKYDIRLRFPEGKYRIETVGEGHWRAQWIYDAHPDGEIPPFSMKVEQTSIVEYVAGPICEDGSQQIVRTDLRIFGEMDTADGRVAFDTDAQPSEDELPRMKSLRIHVGQPLTVTLDKDGRAVSVEGYDAMWEKHFKTLDTPEAREKAEALKKEMPARYFAVQCQNIGLATSSPVAVGESWQTEADTYKWPWGETAYTAFNTLERVETRDGRQVATVKYRILFPPVEDRTFDEHDAQARVYDIRLRCSGTMEIDLATGQPLAGNDTFIEDYKLRLLDEDGVPDPDLMMTNVRESGGKTTCTEVEPAQEQQPGT